MPESERKVNDQATSPPARESHGQSIFQAYQTAAGEAIAGLQRIIGKRRAAVEALAAMGEKGVDLRELLGEATAGQADYKIGDGDVPYPNDPTHYLAGTQRFLDLVNRLCTQSGIVAITGKIQECLDAICDLKAFEACFADGVVVPNSCGTLIDQQGAWRAIEQVNDYIYADRVDSVWMRRGGY